MSHKRFLTAGLALLIIIGVVIMIGSAVYRSGWTQGYMMGSITANGDGAGAILPYARHGYPGNSFGIPSFLCSAGFFVLLFIAFAKFFRFRTLKMAGGPKGEHWARHREEWFKHHGPMPPWCWGSEKEDAKKVQEAEPDTQKENSEPEE